MSVGADCQYEYHEIYADLNTPAITCPACHNQKVRNVTDFFYAGLIGVVIAAAAGGIIWVLFSK